MLDDASLRLLQAFPPGHPDLNRAAAAAGSLAALAAKGSAELRALGLSRDVLARRAAPDQARIDTWRRWLDVTEHGLVAMGDTGYPGQLAAIPDPPAVLWTRGAAAGLLAGPQLAMVGSRNPTAGGAANATAFARALGASGLTITSGLALGIDGASHAGALEALGSTIAVLGAGIDRVYPAEHRALGDRIAAVGLIVSEYPPGTPVRKHQFPARNRIIAGLAVGTLVVEATRRSGSLITARLAAEFGREVFALPGSIHNPLSRGCHALIVQGARLVESVGDVLVELAPRLEPLGASAARPEDFVAAPEALDPKQRKLLDLLGFEPVAGDELAARAGLTAAELSSMLLLLEMNGVVEALPGARYCRLVKRS